MFFTKKTKCFNCNEVIKNVEQVFTIQLKTADGPHEVKMCHTCSNQFDKIALELEEIINERY
jgi:uncharacterized protein with PIN domain